MPITRDSLGNFWVAEQKGKKEFVQKKKAPLVQKGAEIRSLIPAGLSWSSPLGCSWEFCKTLQSRSLRFNLFIYFNVPCLKCLPVALRDDGLCNLGLIFGPSRVSLGLTSFRTNILGLLFLDHLQDCFGLCSRIPLEETEFHLMRVSG